MPDIRAVMAVSIFIASMVTRVWFFSTVSPTLTLSLLTAPGIEEPTWLLSSGSAMGTLTMFFWASSSGTCTSRRMPLSSKLTVRMPSLSTSPNPKYLMTRVLPSAMLTLLVSPTARPWKNTWLPSRMM